MSGKNRIVVGTVKIDRKTGNVIEPESKSELPASSGSAAKPLFVEARIYNERGVYRVVSIGGEGHAHSDMDAAKILRKLAQFIEGQWKERQNKE